ncbi:MAG: hypothetical protein GY810_23445 [Aureispira sp.]|nr:hypothetical protein [Aureispira sp.]
MKSIFFTICLLGISSYGFSQVLIDAAFAWNQEVSYFFRGDKVVKFQNNENKVLKTGTIQTFFPGMPFSKIDAALDYTNGKVYFFRKDEYVRYDKANKKIDPGYPKIIEDHWEALGFLKVDAATSWPNDKSYFFRGTQYSRFDRANDKTDAVYPQSTNPKRWPDMPYSEVDAALTLPNGKTYFFLDDEYVRFDIDNDRMDANYPKNIDKWAGLKEALQGGKKINPNPPNPPNPNNTSYDNFEIEKKTISIAPYNMSSPNSVLADFKTKKGVNGTLYLSFQQKNDAIIFKFNSNYEKVGSPIVLKNYWMSALHPMDDGSLVVLAGKDVNNDYIEGYPNTLYFINISANGNVGNPKHIFGGEGHGPQKSWFDGRSEATLDYNGSEFGIYFEVQKNWAKAGEKQDIHNGDMFVVTDRYGKIDDDRTHFWTASHSSTINMAAMENSEFYTMTIGDAHPYGLQVYNRNKDKNFIAWPPKEDYIPYSEVNSTNAAGILHFMAESDDNLIAILGTVEHPNIGWKTKVDPLFLKFDKENKMLRKKYLKFTPNEDESHITTHPIGKNYLIAFGAGNSYDDDWQAQDFEFCIVDNNANFILKPTKVNKSFGSNSDFVPMSNKEFIWFEQSRNGSEDIDLYQLKFD